MKTVRVQMQCNDKMWHCTTDGGLGVVLESGSFDALVERVKFALTEIMEVEHDYTGPIEIIFETEHRVVTRGQVEDGELYEEPEEVAA
ncbi:MAG: DUF1902 domain-containing protein [Defluviitaleaceae bacterium]|nr:DUF1902 domain-containing protein [Defluviitaleaceae bacterium]